MHALVYLAIINNDDSDAVKELLVQLLESNTTITLEDDGMHYKVISNLTNNEKLTCDNEAQSIYYFLREEIGKNALDSD